MATVDVKGLLLSKSTFPSIPPPRPLLSQFDVIKYYLAVGDRRTDGQWFGRERSRDARSWPGDRPIVSTRCLGKGSTFSLYCRV